jgi:hypothetical protein
MSHVVTFALFHALVNCYNRNCSIRCELRIDKSVTYDCVVFKIDNFRNC